VERDIDFRTVPELLAITLSTYMPKGIKEPTYLLAARAALQAVTGARTEITRVKHGVAQWGVSQGQTAGAKVTVWGEQAYELMDKMVHLVFPKIKDWPGVPGSAGDGSGNLSWGLDADQLALFPEIQSNYDAYPPKVSYFPVARDTLVRHFKCDGDVLTGLCVCVSRRFPGAESTSRPQPSPTDMLACLCRLWGYHLMVTSSEGLWPGSYLG
jgi:ribosomal protein L5